VNSKARGPVNRDNGVPDDPQTVSERKHKQSSLNLSDLSVKSSIIVAEYGPDYQNKFTRNKNHRQECQEIVNRLQSKLKSNRDMGIERDEWLGGDRPDKETYHTDSDPFLIFRHQRQLLPYLRISQLSVLHLNFELFQVKVERCDYVGMTNAETKFCDGSELSDVYDY
jgi:hypothetical protein